MVSKIFIMLQVIEKWHCLLSFSKTMSFRFTLVILGQGRSQQRTQKKMTGNKLMLTISLSFLFQCTQQYHFVQVVLSHEKKKLCSNRGGQLTPLSQNCDREKYSQVLPMLVVGTSHLFHSPFFRHPWSLVGDICRKHSPISGL